MKKALLIAAVAGFVMTSCKKDYVCECTQTTTGSGSVVTNVPINDAKKKDAESACTALNVSVSGGGSSVSQTCVLK